MPSESFNPHPVYTCLCLCVHGGKYVRNVCVNLCLSAFCECVCGAWVSKWESCVEPVISSSQNCCGAKANSQTFVGLSARCRAASVIHFMFTINGFSFEKTKFSRQPYKCLCVWALNDQTNTTSVWEMLPYFNEISFIEL